MVCHVADLEFEVILNSIIIFLYPSISSQPGATKLEGPKGRDLLWLILLFLKILIIASNNKKFSATVPK